MLYVNLLTGQCQQRPEALFATWRRTDYGWGQEMSHQGFATALRLCAAVSGASNDNLSSNLVVRSATSEVLAGRQQLPPGGHRMGQH